MICYSKTWKIEKTLVKYGWQDAEDSEEQCVINDSTGLSWGLDPIFLECPYEFEMTNLSL